MATYKYCDDPVHEQEGGQFTPAIAQIRVSTLKGNTIEVARSWDTCVDHLGVFAALAWDMEPVTEHFYRVTIEKVASD